MNQWIPTGPGQAVNCPHCGYRLLDTGPNTEAQVRKSQYGEPIPPAGSIVKCKGCRQFYLYLPQPAKSSAA